MAEKKEEEHFSFDRESRRMKPSWDYKMVDLQLEVSMTRPPFCSLLFDPFSLLSTLLFLPFSLLPLPFSPLSPPFFLLSHPFSLLPQL